jgi:hypothetical protein
VGSHVTAGQHFIRPELHRLLSDAVGTDLLQWLEDVGQEIADVGSDGASVALSSELLRELNIRRVVNLEGPVAEARLESGRSGFQIFLNGKMQDVDRRVMLAHEIAHVVLTRDKKIARVMGGQKLSVDRDLEKVVDWLAYSILVPHKFLIEDEPRELFHSGFVLAQRWRVPTKIAFYRIMSAVAREGDVALNLLGRYEDLNQLSFFDMSKIWRMTWLLSAVRSPELRRTFVEKGPRNREFRAEYTSIEMFETEKPDQQRILGWMREVRFLRSALEGHSSIQAIARTRDLISQKDGSLSSSYAIWCR